MRSTAGVGLNGCAKQDVETHGSVLEQPFQERNTGDVIGKRRKRNPAVGTRNDAAKLMKSFLIEFGRTPTSRSRLRVEKPEPEDPFEAYLRGVKLY